VGNAFISYARYLGKTLWPHDLSAFYPFPTPPAGWGEVLPAVLLFVVITALTLAAGRRWPWVPFGWLWFVVSLVPVIGLVQVGDQAMADRYTYLPEVGLFAAVVWSAAEAVRGGRGRQILAGVLVAALVACGVGTRMQIRWWRDTPTLYRHMLAIDDDNHVAHLNLATWMSSHGEAAGSIPHFRRAVALRPTVALIHANLGNALRLTRDFRGAERELLRAIELAPDLPAAHFNMAMLDDDEGKLGAAAGHLAKVIAITPEDHRAWQGMVAILRQPGAARQVLPFVAAVARAEPQSRELQELVSTLRREMEATSPEPTEPTPRAPAPP
jgi:Tfp pilus assembly protein PilF